jgi:uncharacterized protein YndB with AHSA1/START domain
MHRLIAFLLAVWLPPAHAVVTDVSPAGFTSTHELALDVPPERAWRALTAEIGRWWDPQHSYSGVAANFTLEPRPGGCFCERLPAGGVEHLRVVYADAPRELRLAGGLGPLQTMAVSGAMQFTLEAGANNTTRLVYRYAVGGYLAGGLDGLAEAVDRVQLGQLQRLARYLATDSPERSDPG